MTLSYISIILGLLLTALPAYLLSRFDMPLLAASVRPLVRLVAQTAAAAAVLWLLWRIDSLWACALWIVAMTAASAWLLLRRCRLPQQLLLVAVWTGMTLGIAFVASWLLLALYHEGVLSPRWVIPVAAVLQAHVLATNTRGVGAYFETLRTDPLAYYTQLGNGASRLTALTPYVRQALRAMTEPSLSALSLTVLFALPMLLSGMLLGGMSPIDAAALFLMLTVGALAASSLSLVLTLWFADRRAFDRRGELHTLLKNDKK